MHNTETVRPGYFRWSSYRLFDGCLTPSPDAVLVEENPWDRFGENARRYRRFDQPYLAVLALNQELRKLHGRVALQPRRPRDPSQPPEVGPRNDVEALLLDWANTHGLLGVLPVRCNWIATGPEGEVPRTVEYHRHGGLWTGRATVGKSPDLKCRWRRLDRDEWRELSVLKLWEFFPLSPNPAAFLAQEIPHPGSETFARAYGEPVTRFAQIISDFAAAVASMSAPPAKEIEQQLHTHRAFCFLRALAEPAETRFYFDEATGQLRRAAFAPGLISSFALMYLMDRDSESQRRVHFCEVCESAFVSNEFQARYCGVSHRNTASSARYRARKHEA